MEHAISISRGGSGGYQWRCSCGAKPNQAWKKRDLAQHSANMHVFNAQAAERAEGKGN